MALLRVTDRGEQLIEIKAITLTQVQLDHLPDPKKSVSIPGYTQTNTPIPLLNQFFVNYATGIISFNVGNTGSVTVTYYSIGENVDAQYLNQLVDYINALKTGGAYKYEEPVFTAIGGAGLTPTYDLPLLKQPVLVTGLTLYDLNVPAWFPGVPVADEDRRVEMVSPGGSATLVAGWNPALGKILRLTDYNNANLTAGNQYRAQVQYLTLE